MTRASRRSGERSDGIKTRPNSFFVSMVAQNKFQRIPWWDACDHSYVHIRRLIDGYRVIGSPSLDGLVSPRCRLNPPHPEASGEFQFGPDRPWKKAAPR